MNLPAVHPREVVVEAAERELCDYLLNHGLFQYADCFGAYGCLLAASAMTDGGLTCRNLPPKVEALCGFFLDLHKRYALTTGEVISIIATRLGQDAKCVIQWERHGCTDNPGGLI